MANEPKVSRYQELVRKFCADKRWRERMLMQDAENALIELIEAACSQTVAPGSQKLVSELVAIVLRLQACQKKWLTAGGINAMKPAFVLAAEIEAAPPAVSTPRLNVCHLHYPKVNADCERCKATNEAGAVSTPRCPNGCEQDLRIAKGRGECQICGHLADWQFFQPVSQPSPWVSVKERMPEFTKEIKSDGLRYSDELLVFDAGGTGAIIQATLNQFDGKSAKWVSDHMGSELHRVTHWMPLPAQPSPEGGSKP